jgi:hypothetical protein
MAPHSTTGSGGGGGLSQRENNQNRNGALQNATITLSLTLTRCGCRLQNENGLLLLQQSGTKTKFPAHCVRFDTLATLALRTQQRSSKLGKREVDM